MGNKSITKKIFAIILIYCITFCFSANSALNIFGAPSKKSDKIIKITVDSRIELLTVVQYLVFGSWRMSEFDTIYASDVEEKFGPYWKHPVLNQYWSMFYYYDFVNNVPHDLMFHLSEPPNLEIRIPIPKEMVKRAGGEKMLNDFLEYLRDFAKKTKFMEFFEDHKELYDFHVGEVTKLIEKEDYVGLLEGYYGSSPNSYAIILSILMNKGGYGVSVGGTMYAIIGPCRSEDREPVFADPNYLFNTTFHQFGYYFIGPLSSKISEDIKKCDKLIHPIYKEMENILYPLSPTWEVCLNEHLIRAITIRILAEKNGPEDTKKKIKDEYNTFFVYIEYVLNMLDIYERNRDIYPNFSDFFPKIENKFEELCEYPLIPTFLVTDYASQNGVQIRWIDNSFDEQSFIIYRKEKEDTAFMEIGKVPANQIYYCDNHVLIGKIYQYVISAVGEKGEIYSNTTDATIGTTKPFPPKKFAVKVDEEKKSLILLWSYSFYCDGFRIIEITNNRTIISDVAPDKREYIMDRPIKGEHKYVIIAWIKGDKDKILESFDSEMVQIIIE
jgi:hypothetical protein